MVSFFAIIKIYGKAIPPSHNQKRNVEQKEKQDFMSNSSFMVVRLEKIY